MAVFKDIAGEAERLEIKENKAVMVLVELLLDDNIIKQVYTWWGKGSFVSTPSPLATFPFPLFLYISLPFPLVTVFSQIRPLCTPFLYHLFPEFSLNFQTLLVHSRAGLSQYLSLSDVSELLIL